MLKPSVPQEPFAEHMSPYKSYRVSYAFRARPSRQYSSRGTICGVYRRSGTGDAPDPTHSPETRFTATTGPVAALGEI
jgi:hypothetical protein